MTRTILRPAVSALLLGLAISVVPAQAQTMTQSHPNSIQPETTLSISATATATAEPDIAFLSGGVVTEAETAEQALRDNTRLMQGVFAALEKAGLAKKNIQTSNFSLQPKWEYPKEGKQYVSGYTATNQVTAKVDNLAELGGLIDAMVSQGGNTFNGVQFDLEDSSKVENQAREAALKEAIARADLYAKVAGYKIARIVTIEDGGSYVAQPRQQMMRVMNDKSSPTPVSGGELNWSATVNVTFELRK